MRQIFTLISCLSIVLITTAQTPNTESTKIIKLRCNVIPIIDTPLLVIDGVLKNGFDLKEVDPDNIERIDILKTSDIRSNWIGCRPIRGVVIITTKAANQHVIKVKDILSGEILPAATVELMYNENGKYISMIQQTDSLGNFKTKKISNDKLYNLKKIIQALVRLLLQHMKQELFGVGGVV